MRSEKLIDQIELYSNAIVGFVVAQSLAFAYFFGKETTFRCIVIQEKALAVALTAHFVLVTVLATWAVRYLSRTMRQLSPENHTIVERMYRAKYVVVALFTLIPLFALVPYGIFGNPDTPRCATGKLPATGPAAGGHASPTR
jgi:mannose/fructose/N-acetylgalactosamine-specific phosphotransferase system component IIC